MKTRAVSSWVLLFGCICLASCEITVTPPPPEPDLGSIQERLDRGESPMSIYRSDYRLHDSIYGKKYEGGLIVFFDIVDNFGMVTTPEDVGTFVWGCEGQTLGGTGTEVRTGADNTSNILNRCTASNTAAQACQEFVLNGYSDWHLPSIDELTSMHLKLYRNEKGNFSPGRYWSSTEYDASLAFCHDFEVSRTSTPLPVRKDQSPLYVRPVRMFYE